MGTFGDGLATVGAGVAASSKEFQVSIEGHKTFDIADKWEDLWEGVGNYPWQTEDVPLEVVSFDTANDLGGTGVRTVEMVVVYADLTWESIDVVLNGLTPVPIPKPAMDVISMRTKTAGSYGWTQSDRVVCRLAGSGPELRMLLPDANHDSGALVTIPKGLTVAFSGWRVFIVAKNAAEVATFEVQRAWPGEAWNAVDGAEVNDTSGDRQVSLGEPLNMVLRPGTRWRVRASCSSTNMQARAIANFRATGKF